MTKKEREELDNLSLRVFGRKSAWRALTKRGEFKMETVVDSNGTPIEVKRWRQVTVQDMLTKMNKIINDRNEEAKKAAEEALKRATEETGETSKETQTGDSAGA